jgi:hypothetical protein
MVKLSHGGYDILVARTVVTDVTKLPIVKCGFWANLLIDDIVVCKELLPNTVYQNLTLEEIFVDDLVSLKISSNINMCYWVILRIDNIECDKTATLDEVYFMDVIRNNLKKLLIPQRIFTVNVAEGYDYTFYRVINPFYKQHSQIIVDYSGILETVQTPDSWQIVIRLTHFNVDWVACRHGAENWRKYDLVPKWDEFLTCFKILHKFNFE